ncbi:MAG: hypothetical protein H6739_35110 [Alphaproteobacteria bacterium]|nr:hypothetical protein [Alphaproteobacteria bacterium]
MRTPTPILFVLLLGACDARRYEKLAYGLYADCVAEGQTVIEESSADYALDVRLTFTDAGRVAERLTDTTPDDDAWETEEQWAYDDDHHAVTRRQILPATGELLQEELWTWDGDLLLRHEITDGEGTAFFIEERTYDRGALIAMTQDQDGDGVVDLECAGAVTPVEEGQQTTLACTFVEPAGASFAVRSVIDDLDRPISYHSEMQPDDLVEDTQWTYREDGLEVVFTAAFSVEGSERDRQERRTDYDDEGYRVAEHTTDFNRGQIRSTWETTWAYDCP